MYSHETGVQKDIITTAHAAWVKRNSDNLISEV